VSATPEQHESERLAVTRRQMTRIVARRFGAVCLLVGFFAALPGSVLLAGKSAGEKGFGAALVVAFLGFSTIMFIAGKREISKEFPRLPVIEATPEELRLEDPSGETFRVGRPDLVSVARLTAPGIRGSRLLFRDAAGRSITHWDLYWIAPVAMHWIEQIGYPTLRITGQAAVKAANPDDRSYGDGAARHRGSW
jgi:hypothetical protein